MGDILSFEPKRKLVVSVCDATQNYQVFDARSVTVPEISFFEHEVWFRDEKLNVMLGHNWSPATIVGPPEIAEAIRNGTPPVRVTFEHRPRKDCWWELHEAYLSTSSTPETHVIHFRAATRHE
jgi:hypothetical protein